MAQASSPSSVPAVERAAAILEFLMRSVPAAPSLSEIHRRLGINKGTAHAILGALARAGLAERRAEGGGWSLGPKTLELGLSYYRAAPAFSLFNRVGDMYPYMVKAPQLWSASFHATDGRPQARAITATMWPIARSAAKALVKSHPADLIVTVHGVGYKFHAG
mgnify:CR=1 FL=1